jgi:hypothetical protein
MSLNIEPDKRLHILAGFAIAAAVAPWGWVPAMLAVCVAAIGKELWDAQGHGTPDRYDALATIGGGAALVLWLALVHLWWL